MRVCVFLLIVFVCGSGPWAPAVAQGVLTEAEAVARVSLESPRARAIRANVDIARADALAAGLWPNPRASYSRESVAGASEQFFLLSQTFPVTGRLGLASDSASAAVRAAELRADDLLRRLRVDARRAFVSLAAGEARIRHLERAIEELRTLVGILAARERAGDAAGFDRLRAEREVAELAAELGTARASRSRWQGELAVFYHPAPDPASLRVEPLMPNQTPLPATEALVARAATGRPGRGARARDADAARLAGAAAARSRIPEPEITAGLKTSSTGEDRRGSVLSLGIALPLFDRAQPDRARADAQTRRALAEREALRNEIHVAIRARHLAVQERRTTADAYRRMALPASEELRRIARVSYDAGERGILELIDAYRLASDAALRVVDLDAAAADAEIDLELATALEIRR